VAVPDRPLRIDPGPIPPGFTTGVADLAGYPFVIASGARCDLEVPGVDPTDPASVLRAYATAINSRDVDMVCSLLADNIVMRNFFGSTDEDGGQVAEIVTPKTFDTDFEAYVISDVEVSGDVVVATHEFHGAEGILRIESTRVTVVDGKIVEWVFGDPVLVASEPGECRVLFAQVLAVPAGRAARRAKRRLTCHVARTSDRCLGLSP